MAVDVLIKATDHTHPDSLIDRRGAYKRGMPVVAFQAPHEWGREERLPLFVQLRITDIDLPAIESRAKDWRQLFNFEILSSDLPEDQHTIRATASPVHPTTLEGALTLAQVTAFLSKWGATNIVAASNQIDFDTKIADAIQSAGFWPADIRSGLIISELSYDQATGRHRTLVNWHFKTWPSDPDERAAMIDQVEAFIQQRATVVPGTFDPVEQQVELDIFRTAVRDEFLQDVRNAEKTICRRRYRINETLMSELVAAGGIYVERTLAQVLAQEIDHTTE